MSEAEGKKEAKSNTFTTSRQQWGSKDAYKKWFQIKSEENSGQELEKKAMGNKTGIKRGAETTDDIATLEAVVKPTILQELPALNY